MDPAPSRPAAVSVSIASQYFLFFGVMGLYLPYFNLYCYHLGFSGLDIGVLSALRAVSMVVFPLLWGVAADRTHRRRPIYILCHMASTCIWAGFLFTEDFTAMALITVAYGVFYAPIISFLEAFSMDMLGRDKSSYGRVRVWGSLSFIGVVLSAGPVIDAFSARVILPAILAGSLLHALVSFGVPAAPAPRPVALGRGAGDLLRRQPLAFILCAFLMLVSHGAYYGFFSIHLEQLGYSKSFIGAAWALASVAEIGVMLASRRLFQRLSLEATLTISFAAAVLRWGIMGAAGTPGWILCAQLLHAATYGAFHMASILYIDRMAPENAKTTGQAVNNALTYGLGLMVGFFLNGYLYERIGSAGLFSLSAFIALAGGLLFAGFQAAARRG
ncbi:MAG: MFS transporter [Desulfobacterales bacterium]|nr:MFS transporter [Desulfobacterales bacterium]